LRKVVLVVRWVFIPLATTASAAPPGFRKDVTPLIHPSGGLRT